MPQLGGMDTDPDGSVFYTLTDADTAELISRVAVSYDRQPAAIRRRDEARLAIGDWQLLREMHDVLTAGGQAYWNTVAPDAGLPATAGAYSTALTFLSGRRDKAMSRALAALNRWRLA